MKCEEKTLKCCIQTNFELNDTLITQRSEKVNKHQKLNEAQKECDQYNYTKYPAACGDPRLIKLCVMNLEEKLHGVISKLQTPKDNHVP